MATSKVSPKARKRAEDQELDEHPITLSVMPIHGHGDEEWAIKLTGSLLTLYAPDGRVVLMLPREDAVNYITFRRDLLHGRTVSFMMMGGLKSHTMKWGSGELNELLRWLPQRSKEEMRQETRLYGVALILLGMVQFVFDDYFFWGWGMIFQVAGIAGIAYPKRGLYALYGTVLFAVGLALLFAPLLGIDAGDWERELRLLSTALGSVLLLWGIQQYSLLGADYQLQYTRVPNEPVFDREERHRSPLVRKVAFSAILAGLVFAIYATILFIESPTNRIDLFSSTTYEAGAYLLNDFVIFGGMAALMFLSALVLFIRRYPPYLEARITGQFLIVVIVLYAWGLWTGFSRGDPLDFTENIITAGLFRLERPYVWAPLIVLLVLFSVWFNRKAEQDIQMLD